MTYQRLAALLDLSIHIIIRPCLLQEFYSSRENYIEQTRFNPVKFTIILKCISKQLWATRPIDN